MTQHHHPENDDSYASLSVNSGVAQPPSVNPYAARRPNANPCPRQESSWKASCEAT